MIGSALTILGVIFILAAIVAGLIDTFLLVCEWSMDKKKTTTRIISLAIIICIFIAGLLSSYASCYWNKNIIISTKDGEFVKQYDGKYSIINNNKIFHVSWWDNSQWHDIIYNNQDYTYFIISQ